MNLWHDRMRRDRIKRLGQQIEKLGSLQFIVIPLEQPSTVTAEYPK
jgi:hypothetical protein